MNWPSKKFHKIRRDTQQTEDIFCFIHRGFKRKIVLLWCMEFTVIKKDYENRLKRLIIVFLHYALILFTDITRYDYTLNWLFISVFVPIFSCWSTSIQKMLGRKKKEFCWIQQEMQFVFTLFFFISFMCRGYFLCPYARIDISC